MLLDRYLIKNLNLLGLELMKKAELSSVPKNLGQLYRFFETLKQEAEDNNDAAANMIYQVLYSFVSSAEVRDRHTSPREFEDIFCFVFGTVSSDDKKRENPTPTKAIIEYDKFSIGEGWSISTDLSANKREKADASIGDYKLSLKTLKGKSYNQHGKITDKNFNDEINVGSFSYRALFKGILTDSELAILGDRKNGLGSKSQIRANVLDPIKKHGKCEEFLERLKLFLGYVYEEDVVIVIKSDYLTDIYFIPNSTFVNTLCLLYDKNESNFEEVWNRWENNNLRLSLSKLLHYMDYFELAYKKIVLNLASFENHDGINAFNQTLNKSVENELMKLIYPN